MSLSPTDRVFAAARDQIEELVKRERERHPDEALAVILESGASRVARVNCMSRTAAIASIQSSRKLEPSLRRTILAELEDASRAQVPVVMLLYTGPNVELGIVRLTPSTPRTGFHSDDEQTVARQLAEVVAPLPGETVHVWIERAAAWAKTTRAPLAKAVLERAKGDAAFYSLGWTIAWGESACPRVIVPHKLAANLMATNCGDDPAAMTCAPWSAYTVEIPPELVRVEIDGRMVSFDVIAVWRNIEGASYIHVQSRTDTAAFGGPLVFPVPDFDGESPWSADDTAMKRATECLQRLVIGVELEMSVPSNVKRPRVPARHKAGTGDGKGTNVHRLVRAVTVDCREAISDFISGERRKTPAMSWLTRGHWRQQPHGPNWSLRRWQQIEPHWNHRGAPVAMRPHRLRDE